MAQYYELCPKSETYMRPKAENVYYSIGALIRLEAESYADCNAKTDNEWDKIANAITRQIWHDLETKGIWYNSAGIPRFIKLESNQQININN